MTFITDEARPHLGGAIEGGDEATYYSALWSWLVNEYEVRSVIDVGCGEGHALKFFAECGVEDLTGIDGINQVPTWDICASFLTHDYTTGPLFDAGELEVDLCWSCEFVEHVEERHIPNFLGTFRCADIVLMTHAVPGQMGWHHVNLREADYWKGVMAAAGFWFNEPFTALTRELAAENEHPLNHYAQRGLAFERY